MLEGAKRVCAQLRRNGYEAFFAGGCVRDTILGREPKDYDIATDARPDDVRLLFDRTILVGEAFGVVRVRLAGHEYEVATFRADGQYIDGRRPESVSFSSAIEDVKRRDFTINALLMDPETGAIIDHVGGRDDIEARVIRAVGDPGARFMEDRLRVLRAVRFACQLGFDIEASTLSAIQGVMGGHGLDGVSPERITEELAKIWRSEPGEGWRLMHNSGILPQAMPYVKHWRRGGALDRLSLENELSPEQREAMAWALSLNDPSLASDAETEMREYLRLTNSMMRRVMDLIRLNRMHDVDWVESVDSIRLLARDPVLYFAWQRCLVGLSPDPAKDAAMKIYTDLTNDPPVFSAMPSGSDLLRAGIPVGPNVGLGLKAAEAAILTRRVRTLSEAIEIARGAVEGKVQQ